MGNYTFELNQFDRSKLSFIKVIPFIGGCPPYSNGNFEVIIKKITFEKVKEEYELGYNLEDRINFILILVIIQNQKRLLL